MDLMSLLFARLKPAFPNMMRIVSRIVQYSVIANKKPRRYWPTLAGFFWDRYGAGRRRLLDCQCVREMLNTRFTHEVQLKRVSNV